jgi:polysaccharide biosynthesis protein PslG
MTLQSGIFKGTPWPPMPIGGIRLWDTYTNWNDLEPAKGTYNWAALDRWLVQARAHGVDVLYTFGDTPAWASLNPGGKCDYNPGGCYPPLDMQDWDDFLRAIATHAAGQIKYWELWNEANQHEYWSGGITSLVIMAKHAYAIIKSVDPSAKVFTPSGVGGTTDTSQFLDRFYASGGGPYVDGVAFHGYGNALPSSPEEISRIVDAVRGVMDKWGQADRPLWDTEASWGPADHLPNEEDRIAFVARHYLLQWSKGVQRSYWYAWNDTNYGTLWDIGSGQIRPAGMAYGEIEKWLKGGVVTAPCTTTADSTWTCGLTLASGEQGQVVWNSSAPNSSMITFHVAPTFVRYQNLGGGMSTISDGTIQIGAKPILLIVGRSPSSSPPAGTHPH